MLPDPFSHWITLTYIDLVTITFLSWSNKEIDPRLIELRSLSKLGEHRSWKHQCLAIPIAMLYDAQAIRIAISNQDVEYERHCGLFHRFTYVDELQFQSQQQKHELSDLYEGKIQRMGNAGRNGGEYYTPRPLIRAIVQVLDPKIGETIYDGAVGSAGFLCEAFDHLKAKAHSTTDQATLQRSTFYGKEKKSLAYVIGIMNMILHGIEAPNIVHTNTLAENLQDIQPKDQHDVVLANPPFGGKERKEVQQNFPIKTGETAFLFLQHFIKSLKAGGRAGIVIKNTFLSKYQILRVGRPFSKKSTTVFTPAPWKVPCGISRMVCRSQSSNSFRRRLMLALSVLGLIIGDWFKAFERSDRTKYLRKFEPFVIRRDISEAVYRLCKRINDVNIKKRMVAEKICLDALPITGNAEQRSTVLQTAIALLLHHSSEVQQYDNALILPPNKKPNQHLLLQRVLEAIDEPSHVTIIQSKWNELYPDTPVAIEQIRAIAIRDPLTFFSIGRTSTYGLKRWENEREHLKGGTIRDIVEEVLSKHDVPLHLDDLLPEVKKFRPGTNAPSVRDNLYLDRSGRFEFLPGNFIGLRSKAYAKIPDPVIRVSGSFFRHSFLKTFVGRNFSDLIDHVFENSAADRKRVESSLKELIHEGRLILDPNGVILHAGTIPIDDPDMKWTGELPFEYGN